MPDSSATPRSLVPRSADCSGPCPPGPSPRPKSPPSTWERIYRLNPVLHAVITVNAAAGTEARASDATRAATGSRGPLQGIPVLVKDNVEVAGMPTTAGSPALLGAHGPHGRDAFIVSRLRQAGAVIIGKANLSEWANFRSSHGTSGWSTLSGQTARWRGPWPVPRPCSASWPLPTPMLPPHPLLIWTA